MHPHGYVALILSNVFGFQMILYYGL